MARGDRRRVPGLRREEVALLAGVSATWYAWLEQGRDINAGGDALDAVCRALQLDDAERRYVRRLAGQPLIEPYVVPAAANQALVALLPDLLPSPACVATESYDVMAWNAAYRAVFGDPRRLAPERRNLVWMAFAMEEIRGRTLDWANASKAGIAFTRAQVAKHPDNPRFREVIATLCEESAEFREAWELQEVRHPPHLAHVLVHPDLGEVRFRIVHLTSSEEPPEHVIIFHPIDDESRKRLVEWVAESDATDGPVEMTAAHGSE